MRAQEENRLIQRPFWMMTFALVGGSEEILNAEKKNVNTEKYLFTEKINCYHKGFRGRCVNVKSGPERTEQPTIKRTSRVFRNTCTHHFIQNTHIPGWEWESTSSWPTFSSAPPLPVLPAKPPTLPQEEKGVQKEKKEPPRSRLGRLTSF